MNAFTIKDIENLTGIKAHTIRKWELRYSFLKPSRTGTNIRYYSNQELKTILNISLLNKYGYKISHIDKMQENEISEKVAAIAAPGVEKERIFNQLVSCMVDLDMPAFEILLNQFIAHHGLHQCIVQVVLPFLEKVGMLWQTNHINPAQEHLVSNIIRQKLIAGIESTPPVTIQQLPVVLFLPENEFHELGLLFIHYMQKSHGRHCLYLGASVPLDDLHYVVERKQPAYLQTHFSSLAHNFNPEKYFSRLSSKIPKTKILISGTAIAQFQKPLPANITRLTTLEEVMSHISASPV